MANEQVTVGLVLTIGGIDNIEVFAKELQNQISRLEKSFNQVFQRIDVNPKVLSSMNELLASANQVAERIATLFTSSKEATVTVAINDASVQKMKMAIESAFIEALSKVRDKVGSIGRSGGSQNVSDSSKLDIEAKTKLADISKATSLNTVSNVATLSKEMEKSYEQFEKTVARLSKDALVNAGRLSAQVGRIIRDPSATFNLEAFKGLDDEFKFIQSASAKLLRSIERDISEIQNKILKGGKSLEDLGGLGGAKKSINSLKERRLAIDQVVKSSERFRRTAQEQIKVSRESIKLDSRRADRQIQINNLFSEGREKLNNLLKSADPNRISIFTNEFEKLSLQITNDIKSLRLFEERLGASLTTAENSFKSAGKELKGFRDNLELLQGQEFVDKDAVARVKALIKSREVLTKSYKDNIAVLKQRLVVAREDSKEAQDQATQVKQTISGLRSVSREFEETDKVIERVNRNTSRLGFTTNSLTNELIKASKVASSSSLNDVAAINQARSAYRKYESQVSNLTSQVSELEAAQEAQLSISKKAFESRSGLFSSSFEKDLEKLGLAEVQTSKLGAALKNLEVNQGQVIDPNIFKDIERLEKDLQSQSEAFRGKYANSIKEVRSQIQALSVGTTKQSAATIEGVLKEVKVFEKLSSSVEDLTQKTNVLSNRESNLTGLGSPKTTDQLRQQSATLEKLRSEIISLENEGAKLKEALNLAQTAKKSRVEITALEGDLRAVLALQAQLKGRLTTGVSVDGDGVKDIVKNLEKAESEIRSFSKEFQRTEAVLGRFEANLKKGGDAAIIAIQDVKKIGTEARTTSLKLQRLISGYENLTKAGVKLSVQERESLALAKQLQSRFSQRSVLISKSTEQLNRQEKSLKRAGQGFKFYTQELGDSIKQNLQFINALSIVTSVLLGLRTAFTELIEESKILARVYTVVRSETLSFADAQIAVAKAVRDAAIQFGESIATTAEVVKQLGSAGFSAETSLAALVPTLKLVVGTTADAEAAARTIAGIYKVFGDEIDTTNNKVEAFSKITDTLTLVYRKHQAELDEINQGLRFSASAAKAAGVPFSDLTAFIAVLNDNFIKSGAAGRGLQVVLSQIAAKSSKIEEAFDLTPINKSIPAGEQFVGILEQISDKVKVGALSVKDLDKTFKIFGLRGARSFITLVKQFDQVETALDEMRFQTKGTADELAIIVRQSLAKEFEAAKQALIGLGRQLIEPVKEVIVFFGEAIRKIQAIAESFPRFTKVTSGLVIAVGVISTMILTLLALGRLFTTLVVSSLDFGKSILFQANAHRVAAVAATKNAVAQTRLGAAMGTTNAIAKASSANLSSFGGVLSSLGKGGKIGLLIGALVLAAAVASKFYVTSRELRQELSELSVELGQTQKASASLDRFARELARIEKQIEKTGVRSAETGQRVVNAFNQVGSNLISQQSILRKTNAEIAKDFEKINQAALQQIALQKKSPKDQVS